MACIMALSSTFIASYYEDPRLIPVILALTAVLLITAFRNPGEAFLKREQNYTQLVKISLGAKLVSVAVAVVSALTLQNYWALVFGQASNAQRA